MWADKLTTKYLFFTGKGGVGKTSLACAVSANLASLGRRVLIVSTDPASNLDEVFATQLTFDPAPVPAFEGLFAANLDPEEAARNYRKKAIGPYRGILPEATLRSMEEQLSGACTTEIAAFDEFTRLLSDSKVAARFDHILFDTAPTGHTLRLLSLPAAWSGFIDSSTTGVTCIGPLSALKLQNTLYRSAVSTLTDRINTLVVLVARPDYVSLKEAGRASAELADLGIVNQALLINGVFQAADLSDPVASALERQGMSAMLTIPEPLRRLPCETIPLMSLPVVGADGIRRLLLPLADSDMSFIEEAIPAQEPLSLDQLTRLLADSPAGGGVIMTMGKGGVGKTTMAAKIATYLADMGHRVLLTTTDPAAHVEAAVGESRPNLIVERIDPTIEIERYRTEILAESEGKLDAEELAVLNEDLRSPCTEEIAVFRAFARAVERGKNGFVVIDTAPTGHTILLMDAAESYHREVLRTASAAPEEVRMLLPRLRDPAYTKILIVTLPEPTPVHEASRLQEDLRRADIEPFAWIVNQSLGASGTRDPLLLARARSEQNMIVEVSRLSGRFVVLPWTAAADTPQGEHTLTQLGALV